MSMYYIFIKKIMRDQTERNYIILIAVIRQLNSDQYFDTLLFVNQFDNLYDIFHILGIFVMF